MDYTYTLRGNAGATCASYLFGYGTPNMPAVNGYTVLNNTVVTDPAIVGAEAGSTAEALAAMGLKVADNSTINWNAGDKGGQRLYAQTGTHAVQRAPMLRTWSTVSEFKPGAGVTSSVKTPQQANYYVDTEAEARQLNVFVENRYWLESQPLQWTVANESSVYNNATADSTAKNTYAVDGGSKGDFLLPVVTVVLPYGVAPYSQTTLAPYDADPTAGPREIPVSDWEMSYTEGVDATSLDQARPNATDGGEGRTICANVDANMSEEWKQKNFKVTYTYEQVSTDPYKVYQNGALQNVAATEYRYVVRIESTADGYNSGAADMITRIATDGLDVFKLNVVTVAKPKALKGNQSADVYENVRSFVTSKMTGFNFLTDNDITVKETGLNVTAKKADNPYTVGSPIMLTKQQLYNATYGAAMHNGMTQLQRNALAVGTPKDARLDSMSNSYLTHTHNCDCGHACVNTTNVVPGHMTQIIKGVYTDPSKADERTAELAVSGAAEYPNYLIGFSGLYSESAGTTRGWVLDGNHALVKSGLALPLSGAPLAGGAGLRVGDYTDVDRTFGLSEATTRGLNANSASANVPGADGIGENETARFAERFGNRANENAAADVHDDDGVYSTVKLRCMTPTLDVTYEVEANPTDRPTDSGNPATDREGTQRTGAGAGKGVELAFDGSVTRPTSDVDVINYSNGSTDYKRTHVKRNAAGNVVLSATEVTTVGRNNATSVTVDDIYRLRDDGTRVFTAKRTRNNLNGQVSIDLVVYQEDGTTVDWRVHQDAVIENRDGTDIVASRTATLFQGDATTPIARTEYEDNGVDETTGLAIGSQKTVVDMELAFASVSDFDIEYDEYSDFYEYMSLSVADAKQAISDAFGEHYKFQESTRFSAQPVGTILSIEVIESPVGADPEDVYVEIVSSRGVPTAEEQKDLTYHFQKTYYNSGLVDTYRSVFSNQWFHTANGYFKYVVPAWRFDADMGLMFGPLDNWIDNETLFVPDNDEVWNYDDTPWFSATVSNNAPDATVETSGSVKHAALVFAVQLPRQVTFYDQNILTGSYRDSSANTAGGGSATYIADYEGDDYAFYVERTWIDRHTGQTRHAQYTPKQLIEDGWTVKITAQPNYSANVYGAAGTDAAHYGKPDTDQPDDTLASRGIENIKPYEH